MRHMVEGGIEAKFTGVCVIATLTSTRRTLSPSHGRRLSISVYSDSPRGL
ncbi:unnamed protein product, partial [Ascophyllum nodosum]